MPPDVVSTAGQATAQGGTLARVRGGRSRKCLMCSEGLSIGEVNYGPYRRSSAVGLCRSSRIPPSVAAFRGGAVCIAPETRPPAQLPAARATPGPNGPAQPTSAPGVYATRSGRASTRPPLAPAAGVWQNSHQGTRPQPPTMPGLPTLLAWAGPHLFTVPKRPDGKGDAMAQQHVPSVIVRSAPPRVSLPAKSRARTETRPKVRAELRAWAQRMQAHARHHQGRAQEQTPLWPAGGGRDRDDEDTGGV